MKIAVASADGIKISEHFGRSACFIIYEIENNQIIGHDVKQNTFSGYMSGQCNHGIISDLLDCEGIISYGIGWRAVEDLKKNNIKSLVLEKKCTPEEAVNLFLQGSLKDFGGGFCRGH